jgi:hypothetical protein
MIQASGIVPTGPEMFSQHPLQAAVKSQRRDRGRSTPGQYR